MLAIKDTCFAHALQTHTPTSCRYELNSISYKTNQLWNLLQFRHLLYLKNKVKLRECLNRPCNIYKSYVLSLGYCLLRN